MLKFRPFPPPSWFYKNMGGVGIFPDIISGNANFLLMQ